MTSLIVATFKNESQALEASQKLSELESVGDITVYEKVLVKKDLNGDVSILQAETTDGVRTVSGMAIGTLVGALAGPVGMLAGMATGMLTGAALEADYFNFSEDSGARVINQMQPGTVAVITEIEEDNPVFVDTYLTPLGAVIMRSDVDYEYDEYVDDQIEGIDEEIAAERARIRSAVAAEKSRIQGKIDRLKEQRKKRIVEAKEKQGVAVAKIKAPIKEEKMSRLKNRIARHQSRIAALEAKLKKME